MNRKWVPCVCNSSLQLNTDSLETDHTLKICMWFGYNPQINFCHFFSQFELSHFSGIFTMKVNGQWVPCVRNSSYSFMPIHLKLYMCYEHGLKICMWFGYNPWIILDIILGLFFMPPTSKEVEGAYWFGSVRAVSAVSLSVMREHWFRNR